MKIAYIGDGRSQITINWTKYFVEQGHEVHLISSYPVIPQVEYASFQFLPLALSGFAVETQEKSGGQLSNRADLIKKFTNVKIRTMVRQFISPWLLNSTAKKLSSILESIQPDLVHALRIPYEGMVTSKAVGNFPFIISIWGNDFTLHSNSNWMMKRQTINALKDVNGLFADCHRDIREAISHGYDKAKPNLVIPSGGGLESELFYSSEESQTLYQVINPRGLRVYVKNEEFFKAIPIIVEKYPQAKFVFPAMAGEAQAEAWVKENKIEEYVTLLPKQSREEMAVLFRSSGVIASPSEHDGTPNSLLEGIACGCFPVAGNIESIREWITDKENGLLHDPGDSDAIAKAIIEAFENQELFEKAKVFNLNMIKEKAVREEVMQKVANFYELVLSNLS